VDITPFGSAPNSSRKSVGNNTVSAGKVVRDDDGQPLAIRRYSDSSLLALLKAHRPERFKDRAAIEHDISDRIADRLEAARLRMLGGLASPAAVVIGHEDKASQR
jgi:hypothetical protein